MSRNLSRICCYYCGTIPILDERPRPITQAETGPYFGEYQGMLVANAYCPVCSAQYLAWVDGSARTAAYGWGRNFPEKQTDYTHADLSFRSSFNDEPGEADKGRPDVLAALERARNSGRNAGIEEARMAIVRLLETR